jgi:hypothetical protein
MRRVTSYVLRLASLPVGVVIGLWTASLLSIPTQCPVGARSCVDAFLTRVSTFAAWECALFGAGAAAVLVLASEVVTRLGSHKLHRNRLLVP